MKQGQHHVGIFPRHRHIFATERFSTLIATVDCVEMTVDKLDFLVNNEYYCEGPVLLFENVWFGFKEDTPAAMLLAS